MASTTRSGSCGTRTHATSVHWARSGDSLHPGHLKCESPAPRYMVRGFGRLGTSRGAHTHASTGGLAHFRVYIGRSALALRRRAARLFVSRQSDYDVWRDKSASRNRRRRMVTDELSGDRANVPSTPGQRARALSESDERLADLVGVQSYCAVTATKSVSLSIATVCLRISPL